MHKTLVLGASGFLGSHVTRKLSEQGRDVRVLVRRSSNTQAVDYYLNHQPGKTAS